MSNKITERMILNALSATVTEGIPATANTVAIPQDVLTEWINRRVSALDKKKASSGLSEKEKAVRAAENEAVYAVLANATSGMTAGQVGQALNPPVTPQKAVGILHRLQDEGKVRNVIDKGTPYWMTKVEG